MRRTVAASAQPNSRHRALTALEHTLGSRLFLYAQNVNNLHEQAGSRPLHMQGELFKSRCERCRVPFDDTNSSLPPLADAVVKGPTDDERVSRHLELQRGMGSGSGAVRHANHDCTSGINRRVFRCLSKPVECDIVLGLC